VTDFIGQVKWIAKYCKTYFVGFEEFHQIPKPAMEYGIASGYVEIGNAIRLFAHIQTVVENRFNFSPGHFFNLEMNILGEYIAVLTALVATIGNMPLKSEIFHNMFF
jgi:hypothetical protein